MKKTMKMLINASLLLTLSNIAFAEELTINVTGAVQNQGIVYFALFDKPDQFPGGKPIKILTMVPSKSTLKENFNKGIYAIAAYQDENNNNKLDKNFIGLPKERVGASGKKSFGKPSFSNASFKFDRNMEISIILD